MKKIVFLLVLIIGLSGCVNSNEIIRIGSYNDNYIYSEKEVDGDKDYKEEFMGTVNLKVGQDYPLDKGIYTWTSRQSYGGGTCGAYLITSNSPIPNEENRIKVSGEVTINDDNSYIKMTDTALGSSGRCDSQDIIGVNYKSTEKITQKVWASYGITPYGKEICSLDSIDIECTDFEYYDELKSKINENDVQNSQTYGMTLKGVALGSGDNVEIRKSSGNEETCYKGMKRMLIDDTSNLIEFEGIPGKYYGEEVDCSELILDTTEMFDFVDVQQKSEELNQ